MIVGPLRHEGIRDAGVDVASVALASAATQGSSYIALVLLAMLVSVQDFGAVKVADSVLSIVILIGSLGIPSHLLCNAQFHRKHGSPLLLRALTSVVAAAAMAGAGALLVLWSARLVTDAHQLLVLVELVWIGTLGAANRTAAAYLQGTTHLLQAARIVAMAAVFGLIVCAGLTAAWGVQGWILGRYASETLALGVLVVTCDVSLRGAAPSMSEMFSLVRTTVPIAVSLILRALLDTLPIFVLASVGASGDVGAFGLATVAGAGVGMLTAAVATVAAPKLAAVRHDVRSARSVIVRGASVNVIIAVAGVLALCLMWPLILTKVFPTYSAAMPIATVLLWAVPIRTLASTLALMCLVYNRNLITVLINVALLGLGVGAYPIAWRSGGVRGLAWCTLVLECVGAALIAGSCSLLHTRWSHEVRESAIVPGRQSPSAAI